VNELREALSYDDVLLVPSRTTLWSRKDAIVRTRLVRDFSINIPILSAPTQWCTGERLAATLAELGGLGVVHRMQSIEHQSLAVAAVKSRTCTQKGATTDSAGRLAVGAAIGATGNYLVRAQTLLARDVDVLVVDVAHGHADYVCEALSSLRRLAPDVPIIAGNVATASGVHDLVAAGADAIKVGVGPGGVCTTRSVTGCGVPQLTAVLDCVAEAAATDTPIIADGGIKVSGDITKALAAGAAAVMIGSLFAGTDESEARTVEVNGRQAKVTTGFASLGMQISVDLDEGKPIAIEDVTAYVAEGVDVTYEYKGALSDVVAQCIGGLKSGMSYCGAATIDALRGAAFVRITTAGRAESAPHAAGLADQLAIDYRADLVERLQRGQSTERNNIT